MLVGKAVLTRLHFISHSWYCHHFQPARRIPLRLTEVAPTPFGWAGIRGKRDGISSPAADNSREKCSSRRKAPLLISQQRSCGAAAQEGHCTANLCALVRSLICMSPFAFCCASFVMIGLDQLSDSFLRSLYALTPVPHLLVSLSSCDSVCFLDLARKLLPFAGYLMEILVRKLVPVFLGRAY